MWSVVAGWYKIKFLWVNVQFFVKIFHCGDTVVSPFAQTFRKQVFFRKFPSYRFAAFKRVDCGTVQDRYTVPPRPRHLYFASVSLIFVAISFLYFCSLHFATLIFENSFQDSVFCISESYNWELLFSILHLCDLQIFLVVSYLHGWNCAWLTFPDNSRQLTFPDNSIKRKMSIDPKFKR